MKKLSLSLLVLSLLLGGCKMTTQPFVDLPAGPVGASIEALHQDGWIVGRALNPPVFAPYSPMNRAEIAVLIVRAIHGVGFNPPDPAAPPFSDVPVDFWGAKWIAQAVADGCMLPMQDGLFHPRSPALRMDVAVLVDNA